MLKYEMKKFFRLLVCYFIIGESSVSINLVYGDVFELKLGMMDNVPVAFLNSSQFLSFIKNNLDTLPSGAINPFQALPTNQQWQMLGYAIFFPATTVGTTSSARKVYVAMKRPSNNGFQIASNNPAVGGHILNFSSNMHTERQLAIVSLEEALASTLPTLEHDRDDLLNGAKIPLTSDNFPPTTSNGTYTIRGELYIYTKEIVCQKSQEDNNNFSCPEYYRALALMFPNVTFHIYTRKKGISFDNNMNMPFKINLLTYLSDYYNVSSNSLNIPIDIANNFFTADGEGDSVTIKCKVVTQWKPIISCQNKQAKFSNDLIFAIKNAVNQHDIVNTAIETLLNHVFSYGIKNITYHLI